MLLKYQDHSRRWKVGSSLSFGSGSSGGDGTHPNKVSPCPVSVQVLKPPVLCAESVLGSFPSCISSHPLSSTVINSALAAQGPRAEGAPSRLTQTRRGVKHLLPLAGNARFSQGGAPHTAWFTEASAAHVVIN